MEMRKEATLVFMIFVIFSVAPFLEPGFDYVGVKCKPFQSTSCIQMKLE
jgi:hypothetical protein